MSKRVFLALSSLILAACATPAQHFEKVALEDHFIAQTVTGQGFEHRVYANSQNFKKNFQTLHVYLDGDGTPRNADPTSRNPLILSLMKQDSSASILVGRPCYHQITPSKRCDESLWTSKRYSQEVVDSMTAALNHWLEKHPAQKITLFGYSGGGTLAVLIADKIPAVQSVITLAANLDVDGWSQAHGYLPLSESLNPIRQKKLPERIKQIHLAGAEDDNVLPRLIQAYSEQQKADYRLFAGFDHQCCWAEIWQKILQDL